MGKPSPSSKKAKPKLEIRLLEASLGFTNFPEDWLMFERLPDDRSARRYLLQESLPVQDQEAMAMKLSMYREFLDNKLCCTYSTKG